MRHALLSTIAALLFATAMPFADSAAAGQAKRMVYKEPEDIIKAMVGCLGAGDLVAALSLFDCEERVNRLDFAAYAEWMGLMAPSMGPSTHDGYRALNLAQERGKAALQVRMLTYSLLLPERFASFLAGRILTFGEMSDGQRGEMIGEFASSLDPERLARLTLKEIQVPSRELQESETNQSSVAKLREIYGFDEYRDLVVIYDLGGVWYRGGAIVTKYDGTWYIHSLSSVFGRTPAFGVAAKVAE